MQRVVVLGRGGAGKSTAAARLSVVVDLPVVDLDSHFWGPEMAPMPQQQWIELQDPLIAGDRWIMEGDLGPHDVLGPRLAAADTVLVLDFSLLRCAWRAARRSRERWDFWSWVVLWRWRSRPALMDAISKHAPLADLHILRSPRALEQFFTHLELPGSPTQQG